MGQTITYPDGSQLTSTALTDAQIQTGFQIITAQMLGILTSPVTIEITLVEGQFICPVNSTSQLQEGQLIVAVGIPDNTFLAGVGVGQVTLSNAATVDAVNSAVVTDPIAYSKVRIGWPIEGQPGPPITPDTVTIRCVPTETVYGLMRDVTTTPNDDNDTLTSTDVYTRAWRVYWTFYGPDSLDNSRAVRSALITIQFVADYLATLNLYVKPDISNPKRVPENFQGEWWERVDMEADFNEQITEEFIVGIVKSVEVIGYTKDGEFTDFTVTSP